MRKCCCALVQAARDFRIGAEDPLDQLRRAVGQPRDCAAVPGSAASAKRISAESECEPVFFMTAARWFSTVRWLMPRSAAMFLLGWPASTSSMIWRWRAVRPARRVAAASRRADNLAESPVLFQGALDAGEQFVAADRLFDEIRSPGLHGLDRHRHVALAGDHDGRQPSSLALEPLQQLRARPCRASGHRPGGSLRGQDDRLRGTPRNWRRSRPSGHLAWSRSRIASRTALSSSTTKMVGSRGPPAGRRAVGCSLAPPAAAERGSAGSGPISSFAFTGLFRCRWPPWAISRKVSVEMSPVRMMAGIS